MGDLIIMTRPTDQVRREPSRNASAEILFFTGVRYYRMPDHQIVEEIEEIAAQPVRRRSAKARKAAEARKLKRLA